MSRAGLGPLDWIKAIAACDLPKREKAVLNALVVYVQYGKNLASCHPSIATLVKNSGWTERSIQDSMLYLERMKVIRISPSPPGWKSLVRTLDYQVLVGLNPAGRAGVEVTQPRRACTPPPHQAPPPPAGDAAQPRMPCTQSYHVPSIEHTKEQKEPSQAINGMDGIQQKLSRYQTVLRLLKEKNIQGENLERLASCESITPEVILRNCEQIKNAKGIRDAPAVLAKRLANHAGITLDSGRLSVADMDPAQKRIHEQDQGLQQEMEALRRNKKRNTS